MARLAMMLALSAGKPADGREAGEQPAGGAPSLALRLWLAAADGWPAGDGPAAPPASPYAEAYPDAVFDAPPGPADGISPAWRRRAIDAYRQAARLG